MKMKNKNLIWLSQQAKKATAILICNVFSFSAAMADEKMPPLSKAQELVNKGNTLAAQEKFEEATACYKQALELEPKNSKALFNIGKILLKKYDYAGAKDKFEEALKSNSRFKEAWNMHGLCCKKMDNPKGAETSFQKAISIDPNYYDALCNLGFLYYTSDRFNESRGILNRARVLPQAKNDQQVAEFLQKLEEKLGEESNATEKASH